MTGFVLLLGAFWPLATVVCAGAAYHVALLLIEARGVHTAHVVQLNAQANAILTLEAKLADIEARVKTDSSFRALTPQRR